jgi:hypothetical protein
LRGHAVADTVAATEVTEESQVLIDASFTALDALPSGRSQYDTDGLDSSA